MSNLKRKLSNDHCRSGEDTLFACTSNVNFQLKALFDRMFPFTFRAKTTFNRLSNSSLG